MVLVDEIKNVEVNDHFFNLLQDNCISGYSIDSKFIEFQKLILKTEPIEL